MKVAFVGGPDIDMRLELMSMLRSLGIETVAIGSSPSLKANFDATNFSYFYYNLHGAVHPMKDFSSLIQLKRIFSNLKPTIVHAFDTKPNYIARFAAYLSNTPIIVGTITGLGYLYSESSWKAHLLRPFYRILHTLSCHVSTMTVFYNEEDRLFFQNNKMTPKGKSMVIKGSGVNLGRFNRDKIPMMRIHALKKELGLNNDTVIILMVSRLLRQKGVLDYLTAAQILRREKKNVVFLLAGPIVLGNPDAIPKRVIEYYAPDVIYLGKREDIPELMASSDIFAFPSHREGMARVLLEAGAMNLPLVTTNVPGCADVVEHEVNGLIIPKKDPLSICNALTMLINNPTLRDELGKNSRKKIEKDFSLEVISRQHADLYLRLYKTLKRYGNSR